MVGGGGRTGTGVGSCEPHGIVRILAFNPSEMVIHYRIASREVISSDSGFNNNSGGCVENSLWEAGEEAGDQLGGYCKDLGDR